MSFSAKILGLAFTPLTISSNISEILNLGASIVAFFSILMYR